MRANTTSDRDSIDPAENFLQVLDQFAALRSYASAQPTIGGYRVLAPARAPRSAAWTERLSERLTDSSSRLMEWLRDTTPAAADHVETLWRAMRERTIRHGSAFASVVAAGGGRRQTSGFLSVLLIGGLAVAVLAGPSSCACSIPFNQADTDRLDYIQNAAFIDTRTDADAPAYPPASPDDLAFLASDRPLNEGEPTVTASLAQGIDATAREPQTPIAEETSSKTDSPPPQTTAAVANAAPAQPAPAAEAPQAATVAVAALAERTADNDDADLSAAAIESNADAVTDRKAQRDLSAKADDDDDDKPRARSSRKRGSIRAYRTPVHQVKRQRRKKATNAHLAQRAPAWAQQMYATTWHSQAFSYNR